MGLVLTAKIPAGCPLVSVRLSSFYFGGQNELDLRLKLYSHLSNKRGGGAKNAKSLNMEGGINVEFGNFLKNQ